MKKMTPMYIIFTGAIIIVVGTVITAIGTLMQNKVASAKSAKQLEKIEDLTSKNAELSIQLSNTALQLTGDITGGDSYCRIRLMPGKESLTITNMGKHPLYDTRIRITDLELLKESTEKGQITLSDAGLSFEIPNMAPGRTSLFNNVKIEFGGVYRSFNINITTRIGSFLQKERYFKLGEKWLSATRILNRTPEEPSVVFEEIDPEFPSDKLNW